ncbi:MAG: hypothetical protein HWE13_02355 [Gammaproteobacteria bacterium]|nr:hypothetical protein [Gammaproteobacteria bacterium]NVK86935.1 hypothetical protein [Gammaproteobacteria bacterium]
MKKLITSSIGLALAMTSYGIKADEQTELADTVNSFMIESYNYVLNINLLIELCASERYLEVDTNSKAFNDKLQANIKKFAGFAKIENYSANKVAADVETKFNAFLQGVRYGGFIADNFVRTQYPKGLCTEEIKKDLDAKINELIKKDEFRLSTIDD